MLLFKRKESQGYYSVLLHVWKLTKTRQASETTSHIIMHIAKRRWRVEKGMCWDSDSQRMGFRLNMYKVWREVRFGLDWMLGNVSVLDVSCLLCLQWIIKHLWVHCENLESVLGGCVHDAKLLFIQISQQKQNCIKGVCLENTVQLIGFKDRLTEILQVFKFTATFRILEMRGHLFQW